jgi:uncharacterized membrane protein YfcA
MTIFGFIAFLIIGLILGLIGGGGSILGVPVLVIFWVTVQKMPPHILCLLLD